MKITSIMALALGLCCIAGADAADPAVDHFGDPLPKGALARLGTVRFRHNGATTLAFTPDDKTLLTCGFDRVLRTWDAANGRLVREQRLPLGGDDSLQVLSADARLLAYWDTKTNSLAIWDVAHRRIRRRLSPAESECWRAFFSPDGKTLVTTGNGVFRAWDTANGDSRLLWRRPVGTVKGEGDCLSFSADGKLLMSQCEEPRLRFWNLESGRLLPWVDTPATLSGATLSPDGRIAAGWDDHYHMYFLDTENGQPIKKWIAPPAQGHIDTTRIAPDGKSIFIGTMEGILVWDPIKGVKVRKIATKNPMSDSLVLSHDGKTLAAISVAGSTYTSGAVLHVWNVATGAARTATTARSGHLAEVIGLTFSPDGRIIASAGGEEHRICLWDTGTGRLLHSLDKVDLPFVLDGKHLFVSGVSGHTILRWDVGARRESGRYPLFETSYPYSRAFALHLRDNGRTLLALGPSVTHQEPFCLFAWDVATRRLLKSPSISAEESWFWGVYLNRYLVGRAMPLPLQGGTIRDPATVPALLQLFEKEKSLGGLVAFSPDDALLAIGVRPHNDRKSKPTAVRIVERATRLTLATLTLGKQDIIAFASDGRGLIAAGADGLKRWDLASGRLVAHFPAPGRFWSDFGSHFARSLAVAANNRTVATGQPDGTILLWDLPPPPLHAPVPLTTAQQKKYWNDLAANNGGRVLTVIARLSDAPTQTTALLRDRLRAVKAPSPQEIRQLLADLDNDEFAQRQKATKRLAELGELVRASLREELERKPTLEVRQRIERLLAAPRQLLTSEQRRHLRAVRVLESINTTEARQILETLAKGAANARLTSTAKATLRRMAARNASAKRR